MNQVYALKNFLDNHEFNGYLLFKQKTNADSFYVITANATHKAGYYKDYGYIEVSDFLFKKVSENSNFFVREINLS